ncbi:heterokaryon incompatibility protein-domain-containing protein [Cladorrhinum sp. PSN259]|nr:heterokaryon incompatibility protein-domain-containing protein [Cladorrhinum sp. PSN259]
MSGFLDNEYPSDWTPLHIAVWRHDFAQTRQHANADTVNQKDSQGWTPVHLACSSSNSPIFYSHQVLQRTVPCELSLSPSRRKPPRGQMYSDFDDNERATAMGLLKILMQHRPRLSSSHFPTPLHCAANSGWLSHARALVDAGAPVYTGPDCSPLCWAEGGPNGDLPVPLFLREKLGDLGCAMIEADHERPHGTLSSLANLEEQSTVKPVLSRPKKQNNGPGRHGLCYMCSKISFKDLCRTQGYLHYPSFEMVRRSAGRCKFCKIITEVLSENQKINEYNTSQVIVRISNGNPGHTSSNQCSDPPILRVLEFKLSPGCTCPTSNYDLLPGSRGALDFAKCRGWCPVVAVKVDIFSETELEGGKIVGELPWSIQQGREIDPDPLGFATLEVLRKWIEACEKEHQNCRFSTDGDPALPTRVIDAETKDSQRIRIQEGANKHAKYLALSHRWVSGPMPSWVTGRNNLEERKLGFPLDTLPATMVDAVRVARSLGIRYLWIDSLCILQDSPGDWQVESSRMASIYANAYITLFADCGRDDEHGFLHRRSTFPSASVPLTAPDGRLVTVNLRKSSAASFKASQFSSFQADLETRSHLSDRGWIFQERVLSRRILHFAQSQLYWECNEGTFGEDGYVVQKRGLRDCAGHETRFSKLSYSSVMYDDSTGPLSASDFITQWARLVEVYSTLKLTRGDDRLPAVAGLAAAFSSRVADKSSRYFDGVWEQDLASHLAWSITNTKPERAHRVYQYQESSNSCASGCDATFIHDSQLFPRPSVDRAPSFSWAAVDGEIKYHELTKPCVISVPSPYGKQNDGCLTVSGPLVRARSYGPFKEDVGGVFCPRRAGYTPLYDAEGMAFGYLLPDSKGDADQRDIYCLKLGEPRYFGNIFLVLVNLGELDVTFSQFRRIGLGLTRDWYANFFDDAEIKTVRLV